MSDVKLFRREDQDFSYKGDIPAAVLAFVNAGNSDTMGGGFGVFGAGIDMEWTVTYDEFIFIHSGEFQLKIGDEVFDAGPGDTLWIPKDTPLFYVAEEDVWFFFAVYPATSSPSASVPNVYPDAPPRPASET
jgi:ethanolamine utilization protein EutQ